MLLYSQVKAISLPDVNGWVRPYDWLQMPALVNNSQVFHGLVAVFPLSANFITVRATGAYTVNWGDGTSENVATNTTAFKNYSFSSLPGSTTTSEGFRQALITVTPQSGQNLVTVSLAPVHNQSGLPASYSSGLLECCVNSPNLTGLNLVNTTASTMTHRYLKRVTLGQNNVTNLNGLISNCTSVESLIGNITAVTDASRALQNTNIKTANFLNNCNSLINVATCFNGCTSLKEVGTLNLSQIPNTSNLSNLFAGCSNLARAQIFGARFAFSVANCSLSQSALVEIFNNLGTASGSQTITISGNYGAASLTTAERQIATDKGWTITG